MALRLVRATWKYHSIMRKTSTLRTPMDVRNFSSATNEMLKSLTTLMNRPPKGFEKFQRDRPKVPPPEEDSDFNKTEEPKQEPKLKKPDFKIKDNEAKFDFFKKTGGGKGGGSGGGNPELDKDFLFKAGGAAALAMALMYFNYMVSRINNPIKGLTGITLFELLWFGSGCSHCTGEVPTSYIRIP